METFPQARSAPIADFSGFKEETIDLFDEPIRVDESHSSSSEGRNLEMDIVSTMPSTDIFQSPEDQEAFGGCRWPIIINVASACSTSNDSLNPNEEHNEHQDLSLNNVHNEHEHLLQQNYQIEHEHLLHQDNRHILDQDGHYEFQDILHPEEHRPISIEDDIALSGDAIDEATAFIVSQPSSTPRDPLASHLPQFNWLEHPSKQYWKKSPISSLEIFHNSSINAAYNEQFAESDNAEVDVDDTIVSVEQTRSIKYPQNGLEFDDDDAVGTVRNQYEYAKKSKKLCGRPSFNPSKTETGTHKQLFEMNNTMFNAMLSNCHGGGFDVATVTSIIDYALKLGDVQKYFTTLREPILANEKKIRKERNRLRCHLEELENELQDAKAKTAEHDAQASMFTTDSLYSMVSNCGGKGYDASTVTNIIKYALKLADVQKIFASSLENILTNEKNIRKERNRVRRNLEELENELQIAKAKTADHDAQALVYTTDSFNSNIERYFNTSGECLIPLPVISHQHLIENIPTKEAGNSRSTLSNITKPGSRTCFDLSNVPSSDQSVGNNTAQYLGTERIFANSPQNSSIITSTQSSNNADNPVKFVNKNRIPPLNPETNLEKIESLEEYKTQRNRERIIKIRKYHENRKALKAQRSMHKSINLKNYYAKRRAQMELEVQGLMSESFALSTNNNAVELVAKRRGRRKKVQTDILDQKYQFNCKEEKPQVHEAQNYIPASSASPTDNNAVELGAKRRGRPKKVQSDTPDQKCLFKCKEENQPQVHEAQHSIPASSASIKEYELGPKCKYTLLTTPAAIGLHHCHTRKTEIQVQHSNSDSFVSEGEYVDFVSSVNKCDTSESLKKRKKRKKKVICMSYGIYYRKHLKKIMLNKRLQTQHSISCSVEAADIGAGEVESVKKKSERKLSTNPVAVYKRKLYHKKMAAQKALQDQSEVELKKKKRRRKKATNLAANKEKDKNTLEAQCSISGSLASSVNEEADAELIKSKKSQNLLNTHLAIYRCKGNASRKEALNAAAFEKRKLYKKFCQHKHWANEAEKKLKDQHYKFDSDLEKKKKRAAIYSRMWYHKNKALKAQEAIFSTKALETSKDAVNSVYYETKPKLCSVKLENCLL